MQPPNERLENIFANAVYMALEARPAYLDAACRNEPALRREVESLLAAHDEAGNLLEPLIAGAVSDDTIPSPASQVEATGDGLLGRDDRPL